MYFTRVALAASFSGLINVLCSAFQSATSLVLSFDIIGLFSEEGVGMFFKALCSCVFSYVIELLFYQGAGIFCKSIIEKTTPFLIS